jgi:molybdopterin synthase sulfur carrier subunit
MPTVYIPTLLRAHTGGQGSLQLEGNTVGAVVEQLEARYPGIKALLLRPQVAVCVNDEVCPAGALEPVTPEAEIHFIAAITGG